jgi:hypothetical protein
MYKESEAGRRSNTILLTNVYKQRRIVQQFAKPGYNPSAFTLIHNAIGVTLTLK